MQNKSARILEIRNLCKDAIKSNMGDTEHKNLLSGVCAFDIGHTTGFNALTQSKGKQVDLTKVQSSEYTLKLLSAISTEIKGCETKENFKVSQDERLYCLLMRGYEQGQLYGQRYVNGKKM